MPEPNFIAWFSARILRDPDALAKTSVLYDDYRTWLALHRPTEQPISLFGFDNQLAEEGLRRSPWGRGGYIQRQGAKLSAIPVHVPPANDATAPTTDPRALLGKIRSRVAVRGGVILYEGDPLLEEIDAALAAPTVVAHEVRS